MNANGAPIGLLLEAFHDGLPEQWSPMVEAEAFLMAAQAQYGKATKAFIEAQAIDLIAHELRKLEEAKPGRPPQAAQPAWRSSAKDRIRRGSAKPRRRSSARSLRPRVSSMSSPRGLTTSMTTR